MLSRIWKKQTNQSQKQAQSEWGHSVGVLIQRREDDILSHRIGRTCSFFAARGAFYIQGLHCQYLIGSIIIYYDLMCNRAW